MESSFLYYLLLLTSHSDSGEITQYRCHFLSCSTCQRPMSYLARPILVISITLLFPNKDRR